MGMIYLKVHMLYLFLKWYIYVSFVVQNEMCHVEVGICA